MTTPASEEHSIDGGESLPSIEPWLPFHAFRACDLDLKRVAGFEVTGRKARGLRFTGCGLKAQDPSLNSLAAKTAGDGFLVIMDNLDPTVIPAEY